MESSTAAGDMSPQHVDAVTLAGWGFNVFPLHGKTPLNKRGHLEATTDMTQINTWWTHWPHANIGARVFAGHAVIDIDPRNGGDTTWNEITRGREIPTTLITRTGSGGRHIWFRLPEGKPTKGINAAPGIDIKTNTGYLVMPGSTHPDTGRLYVCEQWAGPALLPAWLEDLVYKPAPQPRPAMLQLHGSDGGDGLLRTVAESQVGERNHTLFWAACRMYEEGLDILHDLEAAARSCGLNDTEIERTIRSAHSKTQGAAA